MSPFLLVADDQAPSAFRLSSCRRYRLEDKSQAGQKVKEQPFSRLVFCLSPMIERLPLFDCPAPPPRHSSQITCRLQGSSPFQRQNICLSCLGSRLRISLSSCRRQRLVDFHHPPYDKSTSIHYRSSCFLYLIRLAPVHTSLNVAFRFSIYLLRWRTIEPLIRQT